MPPSGRSRRDTWRAMGQAFTLTRKNDPRFIPYLVIFGVGAAAVVYVVSFFVTGSPWYGIPIAVTAGLLAACSHSVGAPRSPCTARPRERRAQRYGYCRTKSGAIGARRRASPVPRNWMPSTG